MIVDVLLGYHAAPAFTTVPPPPEYATPFDRLLLLFPNRYNLVAPET